MILTHDVAAMIDFAYSRIAEGLEMPGIVAISQYLPTGEAIGEIILLAECSLQNEWQDQVLYILITGRWQY